MQNQNTIYRPLFPHYDSVIHGRYNNFNIPLKYVSKQVKRCNYCFSSEEENINPNSFYFLTDKINQTKNQNLSNKLNSKESYSISNSQNQYKEYNLHQGAFQRIENNNNKLSRKNDSRLTSNDNASLNSGIECKNFNSNDADNICYNLFNKEMKKKSNNCILKKKDIAIISYVKSNINDNSSFYNIKNNSYSCYNQPFTKYNSHSLFTKEYQKISNKLVKEYNNKNEFEEKAIVDATEMNLDSNTYRDRKCSAINEEEKKYINKNNLNLGLQKIQNGLNKNRAINNIYKNNPNLNKGIDNFKNGNIIASIKKEKINKPPVNKNISFSNIENLDSSKFIKNHYEIENKKKINLIINSNTIEDRKEFENITSIPPNRPKEPKKIKKISLIGLPNLNDNLGNKNNHSFYEIKSLSKDLSQNNIHSKPLNNNEIISIVCKRKKNNERKIIKEKLIKNNSNLKLFEGNSIRDKNEIKNTEINLTDLNECIKKEGNSYILKKGASKSTFEASFRNEISNNESKTKENINFLNINNNYNNKFIVEDKKGKNIIIKIDQIKHKNSTKNVIPTGKKIMNKKDSNKENFSISKKSNQTINNRGYRDISKPLETKKICSNFFSIYSTNENKSKNKRKKKNKDFHSKKNMIQLLNINNKTYEEDFPLKLETGINNSNNSLKPQISFRIVLFGSKGPEHEKYFVVNTFCSENIREKPEQSESDF